MNFWYFHRRCIEGKVTGFVRVRQFKLTLDQIHQVVLQDLNSLFFKDFVLLSSRLLQCMSMQSTGPFITKFAIWLYQMTMNIPPIWLNHELRMVLSKNGNSVKFRGDQGFYTAGVETRPFLDQREVQHPQPFFVFFLLFLPKSSISHVCTIIPLLIRSSTKVISNKEICKNVRINSGQASRKALVSTDSEGYLGYTTAFGHDGR